MFVRLGSNVAAKADALLVRKPTEGVVLVSMKLNGLDVGVLVETPANGVTVRIKLVDWPFVKVGMTGHVTMLLETTPLSDALANVTRFVGGNALVLSLIHI